ncbi:acyltransferase family protein [Singulisphaera rosea]
MRRIRELDGLRGLAALTVVGFHLSPQLLPYGWAAVDLFFVLSGFLITSIVLSQMDEPHFLRTFYIRRGFRIFPIYYLTLLLLVVLEHPNLRQWLPFAFYVQNAPFYLEPVSSLGGKIFSPSWLDMDHTWSLAVEEQFYLIWPGLLLLVGRCRLRPIALGCILGSIVARLLGYPHSLLITRCDGLALGALLATMGNREASHDDPRVRVFDWRWLYVSAAVLVALLGVLAFGWWTGRYQLPLSYLLEAPAIEVLAVGLISLLIVAIVVEFSGRQALAPLRWKPLRGLGTISYGVYLYHFPIIHYTFAVLPRATPGYWMVGMVISLTATLALSILSWHLVESPILKLKDRVAYDRAPITEPRPSGSFSDAPALGRGRAFGGRSESTA